MSENASALYELFPLTIRDQSRDMLLANLKLGSDFRLAKTPNGIQPSYFGDFRFCQLGGSVFRAKCVSSFRNRIMNVICPRSKKQVRRINAISNVALVEDAQAERDLTVYKFPRITVRSGSVFVVMKISIPFGKSLCPEPALLRFNHRAPKRNFRFDRPPFPPTTSRAVDFDSAQMSIETIPANWTASRDNFRIGPHRDAFLFNHGAVARKVTLREPFSFRE